jgi:hypothetical protein
MTSITILDNLDPMERKGTVYIAWNEERGLYTGYWDQLPEGPPKHVEQMPDYTSLAEVVAWGRERARSVMVRPANDPARYYWAGTGPRPAHEPPLPDLELPE